MNESIPDALVGAVTVERLRLEPSFRRLTAKQKVLVETYISSGGDRTAAAMAAYHFKDRETARKSGYRLLGVLGVVQVLNLFIGTPPLEVFKRDVEAAFRDRNLTTAQIRALELQARINGWGASPNMPNSHGHDSEDEEPAPKVDPATKRAKPQTAPQPVAAPAMHAEVSAAGTVEIADGAPEKFHVGQIVEETVDGVTYKGKVLAVDADGRAIKVEDL